VNVGGQVAVAQVEPVFTAESNEAFQGVKRFAAKAPALFRIDEASQGVGDDIEVGEIFRPWSAMSSPVLTMMVRFRGSISA